MMQGAGGLKAPPTVELGSPIPVDIQLEGVTEILVTTGDSNGGKPVPYPVGPDGKVNIPPDPAWTDTTIVFVSTGQPPYQAIIIEIVPQGEAP